MPAWSASELIAAVILAGTPFVSVVRGATRLVREARSRRRMNDAARAREALRRPAPGTIVVEGRVVTPVGSDELRIVTRRQFGCLGGPIVHDVPAFELERDDGMRVRVEVGKDPVVENLELLFEAAPAPGGTPPKVPPPTGGPLSVARLRGRARVTAVLTESDGRVVPPEGASAVVTILAAS